MRACCRRNGARGASSSSSVHCQSFGFSGLSIGDAIAEPIANLPHALLGVLGGCLADGRPLLRRAADAPRHARSRRLVVLANDPRLDRFGGWFHECRCGSGFWRCRRGRGSAGASAASRRRFSVAAALTCAARRFGGGGGLSAVAAASASSAMAASASASACAACMTPVVAIPRATADKPTCESLRARISLHGLRPLRSGAASSVCSAPLRRGNREDVAHSYGSA